jgi:hypothetical protein
MVQRYSFHSSLRTFHQGQRPKAPDPASNSAPSPPCGRAEQRRPGRIKILDVRRPRSGLVSKISAPAEQRKEPRRGPDFGSPFFGLPYFGEAKKGKSPAAATERLRNLANNRNPDSKKRLRQAQPERAGGPPVSNASPQLKCFPTIPANSNIVTCAFPNTGNNFASALMARLFAASCKFSALM